MTGRDKDPTVKFNQRKKIIKKKIKWNKTKLKKKLKKKSNTRKLVRIWCELCCVDGRYVSCVDVSKKESKRE